MTVPRNAITYLAVDQSLLNPFVLVARLQRHGVHAALATVVARAQPVLLDALQGRIAPREEVSGSTNTPRTSISHIGLITRVRRLLTPCCRAPAHG